MGLILGMALCASEALAEVPSGWLQSYEAPSTCPSEASFREQVEQRLARSPEAFGRVRVSVGISRDISGQSGASPSGSVAWHAALRLTDLEQRTTTHHVVDPSCAALVRALALLVALGADAAPQAEPPAREWAPRSVGAEGGAEGRVDAPHAPSGHGVAGEALRIGAAVSGSVRSALGPEPALGFGVGATLQWAGEGRWAPRLELSLSHLESPKVELATEAALHFEALLVSASACPVRLFGAEDWALRPCVDVEAGQLTGYGSGARGRRRRTAPRAMARRRVVPAGGRRSFRWPRAARRRPRRQLAPLSSRVLFCS